MKQWFILQVKSNCEKKVQGALIKKVEMSPIKDLFGSILVPEEKTIDVKNGTKKEIMRKFYPGYVFVETEFTDDVWHLVKSIPNVLGFLGDKSKRPQPIPQADVDKILQKMKQAELAPVPKMEFNIGEVLCITDGAFKDFEGTVETVNYDKNTLKISVTIFGRSTLVDLDFKNVAKK